MLTSLDDTLWHQLPTTFDHDLKSGETWPVKNLQLGATLHPGTRRFQMATLTARLEGGIDFVLRSEAIGSAIAMQGLGYSGGYNDRKGLGVWRGANHVETDVWDVSAPAQIVYPNGSANAHWRRIQPVAVHAQLGASAESHGTGSMTLVLSGKIPHFGLE